MAMTGKGACQQVDVALVLAADRMSRGLGTPASIGRASSHPGLSRRLDAAVDLWRAGRVKYLIVSGNRESDNYDEPTVMRGVPGRSAACRPR